MVAGQVLSIKGNAKMLEADNEEKGTTLIEDASVPKEASRLEDGAEMPKPDDKDEYSMTT